MSESKLTSTARRARALTAIVAAALCGGAVVPLSRNASEPPSPFDDRPSSRRHGTAEAAPAPPAPPPTSRVASRTFDSGVAEERPQFRLLVIDAATSSPVEGAEVVRPVESEVGDGSAASTSGADGVAAMPLRPPFEGVVRAAGFAALHFAVARDAPEPQTLALTRGRTVVVECVDRAGVPVEGCVARLAERRRDKEPRAAAPAPLRTAPSDSFAGEATSARDGVVRISNVADGSYTLHVEHPFKIRAPETMTERVVVAGGDATVRAVMDHLYGVVFRLDPNRFSSLAAAPRASADGFDVRAEKLAVVWSRRMREQFGTGVVAYATARRPDADGPPGPFEMRGFSAVDGWCRVSAPLRVVDVSAALTEPRIDVEDPLYRPSWLEVRALQPDGRELKGVPFVVATEAPKGGLHVTGRSGERTALPPGEYRIEFSAHCGARRYFDHRKVRLDPGAIASVDLTAARRIGRVAGSSDGEQPDRSRGLGIVVDGGREDRIVFPTESSFFAPCDGELVVTAKAVRRTPLDEPADVLTARVGRDDWRVDADGAPVVNMVFETSPPK